MKIRRIDLDDQEKPERITAEITRAEALYLASLTDGHSLDAAEAVMPGGGRHNSTISTALLVFFDRFYDNGASDALLEDEHE